ncbi:MAG: hypothetical protein DRP42_05195 [Tenericutes bacterium]|nr:MAG: hypothetical protein DRP42_05195 [Mycoplasmatota bacterium]
MTISSEESIIEYSGDGVLQEYSYSFRVDQDSDLKVYLNGIIQTTGFTLARSPDNVGGTVTFDVAPGSGVRISLSREVPITQEVDYQPYDPFPAETHERALDKLTMIAQQVSVLGSRAIRIPASEDPEFVHLETPSVALRAEKVLYFDDQGNVSVIDPVVDAPAVYRIDIQNGDNGEDSRSVLAVDTVSGGLSYPKIGFKNINKPNGPVQLDAGGKLPPGMVDVQGIFIRGPFRGDDLCDKPGDDPGECLAPDTRNPSERNPELADTFAGGDTFIVTMEDGELDGTMNLFTSTGDPAPAIVTVRARDGVMYLEELENPDNPGEILTYEGWYHIPKLVDTGESSSVIYNPDGNTYVLGTNVQVALDDVDNHLQERDSWNTTDRSATREGILSADANLVFASGFYRLLSGSANLPSADAYTLICSAIDTDNISHLAVNISTNKLYSRTRTGAGWSTWAGAGGTAGVMFDFGGVTPPDGSLRCDGSSLSEAAYPELYAAIGNAWDTTAGAASPGAGNFRLPIQEVENLGVFHRGVGTGNGPVGTYQGDVFKAHTHVSNSGTTSSGGGGLTSGSQMGVGNPTTSEAGNQEETRPRSISVTKCIWTGQ